MDYQPKYNSNCGGFSLVELVVVIGLTMLLMTISNTVYVGLRSQNNREISSQGLVEALRYAQANAQAGNADSKWGVKILLTNLVIFKGQSYDTRDVTSDQALSFLGGVTAAGLTEVVFEKLTGSTLTTGTTTLSNSDGIKNIFINEKGTITY